MLVTTIFTLCSMLGAAAAAATPTCNADNCLRAVKASAFPSRMGVSDCSSYFMVTVTPAVGTSSPTVIPGYASSCSGSSRYSSACSCVGVTHATTTVVACTPSSTVAAGGVSYTRYYIGYGFTENTNNPGNDNAAEPPQTTTIAGSPTSCEAAAESCQAYAYAIPGSYFTYDLHYLQSKGLWECVVYWDPNQDPSYFNVANADVAEGYGYYIY